MPRTKSGPSKPQTRQGATSNGTAETPEVLTLDEAASYLRVPAGAVLCMIDAEGLPARRFGADWRFYRTALQAWLGTPRPRKGILRHVGKIKDDPYAHEMLKEIYAKRGRPEIEEE